MKSYQIVSLAALVLASSVACGSGGTSTNALAPKVGGSLGMKVTVPAIHKKAVGRFNPDLIIGTNETLSTVNYTLTDGTNTYTGVGDVSNGTMSAGFLITDIATSNYSITLTGSTADISCTGNAPNIAVTDGNVTTVDVILQCVSTNTADGGVVDVVVSNTDCPVLNYLAIANSTVAVGSSTSMAANATTVGSDVLYFNWMTLVGAIGAPGSIVQSDNTDGTAVFTCFSAGVGGVQLQIVDTAYASGATAQPSLCPATMTANITCQ